MNSKRMINFTAGIVTAFFSCKKEEPLLFNEVPAVYFSTDSDPLDKGLFDTTSILSEASLYGSNGTISSTFYIHTVGLLSAVDRPVRLTLKQEGTVLQKGIDYEIKPDTIIIPAGKTTASFSITRKVPVAAFPDFYDPAGDNILQMQLLANDFFNLDKIKTVNSTLNFYSGFLYYKPFSWIWYVEVTDVLRLYSRKKVEVLVLANRQNNDLLTKLKTLEIIPAAATQFNAQYFYILLHVYAPYDFSSAGNRLYIEALETMVLYAKQYLDEKKAAGQTVFDENGVEVTF